MKKTWLQLLVVLILAITFTTFPLLVYTPIPTALNLTPITRDTHNNAALQNNQLLWLKHPNKEQFFAIPKQKYPEDATNKIFYLAQTPAHVDFYNTGSSYLIVPHSQLGKFLANHPKELNAKATYLLQTSSKNKYQIMHTVVPAWEVAKQGNNQIVLSHLSEADYAILIKQKMLDAKINKMIVAEDPIHHNITINPSIQKANLKIWLQNVWKYLKSSLNLDYIVSASTHESATDN